MAAARPGNRRFWWMVLPALLAGALVLTIVLALGSDPETGSEPQGDSATTSPTGDRTGTTTQKRVGGTADRSTGALARAYLPTETFTSDEAVVSHAGSGGAALSARWDAEGRYLLVTTFGSSSCATGLDRIVVTGPQRLELSSSAVTPGVQRSCTADIAAFVNEIVVPEGIRRDADLTLIVGEWELTLAGQR